MQKAIKLHKTINPAVEALGKSADSLCRLGRLQEAHQIIRAGQQVIGIREVDQQIRIEFLLRASAILVKRQFCTNTGAEEMLSLIRETRQEAERINHTRAIADALSLQGQGNYYMVLNNASSLASPDANYDEALRYQEEALKLREELRENKGICESLFYIGIIHERKTEYELAQEYYLKVRALATEHNHIFERCEATRHLANITLYRGALDQALLYAKEALSLRLDIGFKLYLPYDYILLGQIYTQKGDLDNALQAFQHSIRLSSDMEQKKSLSYSLIGLGEIQAKQEQTAEAVNSYREALALAEELNIPRAEAMARERLEHICHEGKNRDKVC